MVTHVEQGIANILLGELLDLELWLLLQQLSHNLVLPGLHLFCNFGILVLPLLKSDDLRKRRREEEKKRRRGEEEKRRRGEEKKKKKKKKKKKRREEKKRKKTKKKRREEKRRRLWLLPESFRGDPQARSFEKGLADTGGWSTRRSFQSRDSDLFSVPLFLCPPLAHSSSQKSPEGEEEKTRRGEEEKRKTEEEEKMRGEEKRRRQGSGCFQVLSGGSKGKFGAILAAGKGT